MTKPAPVDGTGCGRQVCRVRTTRADSAPPPQPQYGSLTEWVEDYFVQAFGWQVGKSVRWCASWWDHPEAIIRLSVLWQLWEVAVAADTEAAGMGEGSAAPDPTTRDPAAMGSWLRDWLDRLMPVLTREHGTFARCSTGIHVNGGREPSHPVGCAAAARATRGGSAMKGSVAAAAVAAVGAVGLMPTTVMGGAAAAGVPGLSGLKAGAVPAQYQVWVLKAGQTCPEIPPAVVAAQIETESGWNRAAVSPVGAQGLSQFMPARGPRMAATTTGTARHHRSIPATRSWPRPGTTAPWSRPCAGRSPAT